jgi:hypothetical protein
VSEQLGGDDVAPADDAPVDERRTREIEIDVLVAHELATGSVAAALIWKAAKLTLPRRAKPSYQVPFPTESRTTDVRVRGDGGVEVFIEDKAAGGRFTVGQTEAYGRLQNETHRSVLVAPQSFLDARAKQRSRFTGNVSLQDLANALDAALPRIDNAELVASYRHRAKEFRRCAADPVVSQPYAPVDKFGEAYRQLAANRNSGLVQVSLEAMRRARTREIDFQAWSKDGNPYVRPYHKLNDGHLDFRVPGYRVEQLRSLLNALPPDRRPPQGWEAVRQRTGKHPVLRFHVAKLDGHLDFERFRPTAEHALDALAELRQWWDRGGEDLLRGSTDEALCWLVLRAAEIASQRGLDAQADDLKAVHSSLLGGSTEASDESVGRVR